MCGIVGVFQYAGNPATDVVERVTSARDLLTHRGPDDAGIFVSPGRHCVLGHRRLSILDLSPAAHQPMSNEDDDVWIVFNGEIYNFQALRAELVARGHRFRSQSDTETILHLYEERGAEIVEALDGMFAFVIYDARQDSILAARDRMGIKPLYYCMRNGQFAFASEPKALLALPQVRRDPRTAVIPAYLAFNCVPGPDTLFQDVQKLEPGSILRLERGGSSDVRRYWWPRSALPEADGTEQETLAGLHQALEDATRKRMISDVPFGAMLSGGLDSSLTVALMSDILQAPIRTFTIGYPGDADDADSDLRHARLVAQALRTEHRELILTHDDIVAMLDELPAVVDDPIGAPSVTANLSLARLVRREGVTVAQVGEGADEVFTGYGAVHRLWRLRRRLRLLDVLLHPRLAAAVAPVAAAMRLDAVSLTGARDGTVFEHVRRRSRREHLYWGFGVLFTPDRQRRLRPNCAGDDPYSTIGERLERMGGFEDLDFLDQLTFIDLLVGLPERLLMRVDKATMQYSVEARVPFLDPAVLHAALSVPPSRRASRPKGVLRDYAANRLPKPVLSRRKVGFPTARGVFLSPPVRARLRAEVLEPRFVNALGLNPSVLAGLFDFNGSPQRASFYEMWSLYVLALWYHFWVEDRHP